MDHPAPEMVDATLVVPGDIAAPTGGYAYAREVLKRLSSSDGPVRLQLLTVKGAAPLEHMNDPDRSGLTAGEIAELEAASRRGPCLIDGLLYGALAPSVITQLARPPLALVHHPLALETGLSALAAQVLWESERLSLSLARHVIAASPTTADVLVSDYGVPRASITVARPGTTPPVKPRHRQRATSGSLNILTVGTLTRRKGHLDGLAALATLTDRAWHWHVVGDITRDPETVAAFNDGLSEHGLSPRVTVHGAISDAALAAQFADADLFFLPSHYEGYGMAYAEALSYGLAIVATRGGATEQTVPADAAQFANAGDIGGIREALSRFLDNPARRTAASAAAAVAWQSLPNWDETARIVADVLVADAAES